jgi:ABC-type long-subunit fatty acid transport system fused permease/ATPase subunit
MVGLVIISVVAIAFIVVVGLWVEGIDYMNTHHPDYKGEDLFNEDKENEKENIPR